MSTLHMHLQYNNCMDIEVHGCTIHLHVHKLRKCIHTHTHISVDLGRMAQSHRQRQCSRVTFFVTRGLEQKRASNKRSAWDPENSHPLLGIPLRISWECDQYT